MATKKLRGGPTIEVSDQILRWRQKMRRKGIVLGKAMARAERKNTAQKQEEHDEKDIKSGKKRWF